MAAKTPACPAGHWRSPLSLLFALAFAAALARDTRGNITLSVDLPTYLPAANLVSYVLHAHSDNPSQPIIGIDTPNLTAGSAGLHQVWNPLIGETPTRGSQLAAGSLWSDTWLPYDSYWFFDNSNSVAAGTAFTESNNLTGGANLPPFLPFPPLTDFWFDEHCWQCIGLNGLHGGQRKTGAGCWARPIRFPSG